MTASTIQLSVIIPCFNAGATLAEQLDALSAQKWSKPWELIVSDNGSTDNSNEIAQQYKDRFHAFKIVDSSEKRGGANAVNKGVIEASSDNIAVCDADDEVTPGWVAAMGDALSKHEIVCGKFKFDKFNAPEDAERALQGWETGLYVGRFLPGGGSGNYGIRKSVHDSIDGFDTCFKNVYDADYFWRLQLKGHKLHVVQDAVIQIRLPQANSSLSYRFRKAKGKAASNYWLYKRYKEYGMRAPKPFTKIFIEWTLLLRNGMRNCLKNKENRFVWLPKFAQKTGFLVGEIQGRLSNPCKPFIP